MIEEHSTAVVQRYLDELAGDTPAAAEGLLARLHEPSALDTLATDERKECPAPWQAVGDLLKRAQEGK